MKIYDPAAATLLGARIASTGLYIAGSKEAAPPGSLRRARGVYSIASGSIRSRYGSSLLFNLAAHSLYRFGDIRFQGVGTGFYRNGIQIYTHQNNERLAFVRMKPSPDVEFSGTQTGQIRRQQSALGTVTSGDYLFIVGGVKGANRKLQKVDANGIMTNWGIDPPIDGFTASKQAATSTVIDNFDNSASFTAFSSTLASEALITQEGGASLKMTVAVSTTGVAYKALGQNLSQFSAGVDSSLEDHITVWVRVDDPTNLRLLQLRFDVSDATFNTNYFALDIPVVSNIIPAQQLVEQTIGVGSTIPTASEQDYLIARDAFAQQAGGYEPLTPLELSDLLSQLSQGSIVLGPNLWTKLRIPKRLFNQTGSTTQTWADVRAFEVVAATNDRGSVVTYWDDMRLEGGTGLLGTYRYRVTHLNSLTGSRSNPNPNVNDVRVEGVTRQAILLSSLPASDDPQVDKLEIWRTVGGGASYFKAAEVNDGVTSYLDVVSDFIGMNAIANEIALESIELPLDNDPPENTFDDAIGPYLGSMWWCRDSTIGAKGRVYYSPVGRPESVLGFVYAGTDDNPTQKLIVWNEHLYCFVEGGIKCIEGIQEPFIVREVFNCPGTSWPQTVVGTPYGILYRAHDGIRLFNGATSMLVDIESIYPILRGASAENLVAFHPVVATYARDEYICSDGNQTLAHNLRTKSWRDLGIGCTALFFEDDTGELTASFNNKVYALESEGVVAGDDGTSIAFEVEFPSVMTNSGQLAVVRMLYIEINTHSEIITPTLILDSSEVVLPAIVNSAKGKVEIPINRSSRIVGVRLSGSLANDIVEVFQVEADIYVAATQPSNKSVAA